jgi:YD repeat-containing protein
LPTRITRSNGAVTTMAYDANGNLLNTIDPFGFNGYSVLSGRDARNAKHAVGVSLQADFVVGAYVSHCNGGSRYPSGLPILDYTGKRRADTLRGRGHRRKGENKRKN